MADEQNAAQERKAKEDARKAAEAKAAEDADEAEADTRPYPSQEEADRIATRSANADGAAPYKTRNAKAE